MFAITIAFGTQSWRLLYKTQEKAEEHYKIATSPVDKTQHFNVGTWLELIDDFGQRACVSLGAIAGVMLENLDESKVGNIEMGLHNQRTQVSFQQRAEQDPTIRAAAAVRSPILSPMGPNGRYNG